MKGTITPKEYLEIIEKGPLRKIKKEKRERSFKIEYLFYTLTSKILMENRGLVYMCYPKPLK